mgnify:CR=1 FL=1|tara:strand:+ start:42641 stop:43816 length:1176 start_codon:yes stop_codon:yes gene_type:complete
MKFINSTLLIFCISVLISCAEEPDIKLLNVKNTLTIERSFETVELSAEFLQVQDLSSIGIREFKSGKLQVTQLVDNNSDGTYDELLFQPILGASSEKDYEIVQINKEEQPSTEVICYARFVPERTDDYAWENDKVAFRTFGPIAQKMKEDNIKGGTLTSGIDAWLKKVDYPIINKWYKEDLSGKGSYHKDTGEGLDNFHVGASRGVGGIAAKVNNNYYFSKNFTEWKTITTGPIRTSFVLKYANWEAGGNIVEESQMISLDLGNNLSKFSINLHGISTISAGLTLHEKDGVVIGNKEKGWVSYWQPHEDSELGSGIVASTNTFLGYEKYDTDEKDLSNAYAALKLIDNKVVYYAGFGWKESGVFKNQQDWENYLSLFSDKINNPLILKLIE